MKHKDIHVFKGMQADIAEYQQPADLMTYAKNIRITARGDNTSFLITNERNPLDTNLEIEGHCLGYCTLGKYFVAFTKYDLNDRIVRVDMETLDKVNLYDGNLNFSLDCPIECLGIYENESIQKVYWTDNRNQPRVVNIVEPNYLDKFSEGSFNFVQELSLDEHITFEKTFSPSSIFAPGTIQYAFSYFNKYGSETNLFYVSPIFYTSYNDRGGSAEDKVGNSFKITIENIDKSFDYIRIYSILRTSEDAAPSCKRIQDIAIPPQQDATSVSYVDAGTSGDEIDPAMLLYVGGEEILAETMCTKDNVLFFGNITIRREGLSAGLKEEIRNTFIVDRNETRMYVAPQTKQGAYSYASSLNAVHHDRYTLVPTAGFKSREYYRLGIQFQHKNGKWSEPVWLGDYQVMGKPSTGSFSDEKMTFSVPTFSISAVENDTFDHLKQEGYVKARALVVYPKDNERTVICQGIASPTVYTETHRYDNADLYSQSSWFFRPIVNVSNFPLVAEDCTCIPFSKNLYGGNRLLYTDEFYTANTHRELLNLRNVEIEGLFDIGNQFRVDWETFTVNTPDLEFKDTLYNADLTGTKIRIVGISEIYNTLSDIDIELSTPPISSTSAGFMHQSFKHTGAYGIVAGLFFEDYIVDDNYDNYVPYDREGSPFKYLIYPWQGEGSLNNDCSRGAGQGTQSALLLKKKISNLRISNATYWAADPKEIPFNHVTDSPKVFHSDQVELLKIGGDPYLGNVDTMLIPDHPSGKWMAYGSYASAGWPYDDNDDDIALADEGVITPFDSTAIIRLHSKDFEGDDNFGFWCYDQTRVPTWKTWKTGHIGDDYKGLVISKRPVRMRYKSSPHLVCRSTGGLDNYAREVVSSYMHNNFQYFPVVEIYKDYDVRTMFGGQTEDAFKANLWLPASEPEKLETGFCMQLNGGDTWFNRYDCLKTYAFSPEDKNQIIEIGSFYLESSCNVDGRYDRNRGQNSNLDMSPINFNLFNPVYSQKNSFFNYRLLDEDYYKLNSFPNQITWSLEKSAASLVDSWTQVTLASTYDMDGTKGKINALRVWKDKIFCFQDNSISEFLFNSRVAINTSDGVPIEISNSKKAEGKKTYTEEIGCYNKYAICTAPEGLYFVGSVDNELYRIGESIANISNSLNMGTWMSRQPNRKWLPTDFTTKLFYDFNQKDLYIVTKDECLGFCSKTNQFTSFFSYEDTEAMFNIGDSFYALNSNKVFDMFKGAYNEPFKGFSDTVQPYEVEFISNGIGQKTMFEDKIFTNMECRCMDGNDALSFPFDHLEVHDTYQEGSDVFNYMQDGRPNNIQKKFNVWHLNIPRALNRRDRIRDIWCRMKLTGMSPREIKIGDISVVYYV